MASDSGASKCRPMRRVRCAPNSSASGSAINGRDDTSGVRVLDRRALRAFETRGAGLPSEKEQRGLKLRILLPRRARFGDGSCEQYGHCRRRPCEEPRCRSSAPSDLVGCSRPPPVSSSLAPAPQKGASCKRSRKLAGACKKLLTLDRNFLA